MSVANLTNLLDNVHLGGLIVECVVIIKDKMASVQAMDMTSTVFVQASCEFHHEDDQWGIGNLPLFIKYLRAYQDSGLTINRKENRLLLKPEKGTTAKYLTADPSLIPTFDEEWISGPPVEGLMAKFSQHKILSNEKVSEFLKLMKLFELNTVRATVNEKGIVQMHGGNENEHQFVVNFGKSDMAPCDIKIYGKFLIAVLSRIEGLQDAKMYLDQEESVLIETPESMWVIGQVKNV